MNKTYLLIAAVVLVIVAGVFWAMRGSSNTATQTPSTQTEQQNNTSSPAEKTESSSEAATEATNGVKEFTVTGSPFKFEPNMIKVKKGDTIKVTFKNEKGFHDFTLDEFNVKTKQIQAGESETVTFKADKQGSFEYYCSVGNHRQMGMKGTLVVE